MSSIKVNFEIGHEASQRSKKTPEGFTHDWEVFVRGQEGADISHFVDKVVFHLHETFPRPRRAVKEPPFSISESGYAGFIFPIEIYLKNKDEPKKIMFTYDFTLQGNGCLKDRYVFQNPNEEFKKKLLKGGGIPVSNNAFYTNPNQEGKSKDFYNEEKQQLLSKPKLSSENVKKHKVKEHKEEVPHRTSSFENLFGPPIQKPPKVSPDPKKLLEKSAPPPKSDKKEKDRGSTEKKSKHEHKESKPEKIKIKEDKDKIRSDKAKSHSKEQDKPKDKASKRPSERPTTPEHAKKRCLSPVRKPPSPPQRSSSASSMKEEYKILKQNTDAEQRKPKLEDKQADKEVKEKKKKEKKSHDRDKERKDKKESKKENLKIKESLVNKEPPKEPPKEIPNAREIPKETLKESAPVKEKPAKPEKPINKFSIENLRKTPPPDSEEKPTHHKSKEKQDERKHKHKKKDKKRDESREKHKELSKEKKHKHEKARKITPEKPEIEKVESRETPVPKERPAPEMASPISLVDTASQCSSKSGIAKISQINDDNSSHSDSESSVINEEEETMKPKIENPSPEPIKQEPSPEPEIEPEPEPELKVEPEPEPIVEAPPPQPKEKSKKHKDKSSKREEKRRKRKAAEEEEEGESRKIAKTSDTVPVNPEPERGESSGSVTTETKVQDNGVSSSLGEDAEPGDLSPDYMVQLRDLQQRIMKIKNNEDLERVVNLIAETGRYEVTTQTFDFDLCLLDRSTVQQLIRLVGC